MARFTNYVEKYRHFHRGEELFEECEYYNANKEYQLAIDLDLDFADAHHSLGHSLFELKKYEDASEKFKKCIALDNKVKAYFFDLGNTLFELKNYQDAIENFEKCIKLDINEFEDDINFDLLSYNNIAHILYSYLGKYKDAKSYWQKAKNIYEREENKAKNCRDADFFRRYGDILCCGLGYLDKARYVYEEGVLLEYDNTDILESLIFLYIEMHKRDNPENKYYLKARENFKKAERLLENQSELKKDLSKSELVDIVHQIEEGNISKDNILYDLHQLGRILLIMEEYEKAEKVLLKTLSVDNEYTDVFVDLGILYLNKDNVKDAIKWFKFAKNDDPYNLMIKDFLAYAYLKEKLLEDAEKEYKEIHNIAPYNLDSLIGLGKVFTEMAESKEDEYEEDMYDEAVKYFDDAIDKRLKEKENASRIKRRELANTYYSRGYARIKLYESKILKDENFLREAMKDFEHCFRHDHVNYNAKRAKEKIETILNPFGSHSFSEKIVPRTIFVLSILTFFGTQYIYVYRYVYSTIKIDLYYTILTFFSLVFISISAFLPQIIKIKFHNLEIEKIPGKISSHMTLRIKKLEKE